MTPNRPGRDLDCDLLVIGGGAAGLAGAVTAAHHGLEVIVAEKAPVLGGATSWSGGWMWAPLNPLSQADGIVEDIDAPRTYLEHALGEHYDERRVEAFLQNARHMVAFFQNHTALQFVSGTWIADIHGDLPGAGTGGRSVGPEPINMRRIPEALRPKLRAQLYETSFLGMGIMAGRTCRRSCTRPAHRCRSSTPHGASPSTSWTWSSTGRGCSWSPDGLDFLRRNPSCEGWVYTATLQGRYDRTDRPLETEYRHPGTERRLAALTRVATARGLPTRPGGPRMAGLGEPVADPDRRSRRHFEQVEHAVEGASTILTEDELTALDTA